MHFDVDYTLRHVRRLMIKQAYPGERRDQNTTMLIQTKSQSFNRRLSKGGRFIENDWTIISVDQHHKQVAAIQRRGWFATGSNPTVDGTGPRYGVTLVVAISPTCDSFYTWTEEATTAEHGFAFLLALIDEFGENIDILTDRAPHFNA